VELPDRAHGAHFSAIERQSDGWFPSLRSTRAMPVWAVMRGGGAAQARGQVPHCRPRPRGRSRSATVGGAGRTGPVVAPPSRLDRRPRSRRTAPRTMAPTAPGDGANEVKDRERRPPHRLLGLSECVTGPKSRGNAPRAAPPRYPAEPSGPRPPRPPRRTDGPVGPVPCQPRGWPRPPLGPETEPRGLDRDRPSPGSRPRS
jgi:hypothetical protein